MVPGETICGSCRCWWDIRIGRWGWKRCWGDTGRMGRRFSSSVVISAIGELSLDFLPRSQHSPSFGRRLSTRRDFHRPALTPLRRPGAPASPTHHTTPTPPSPPTPSRPSRPILDPHPSPRPISSSDSPSGARRRPSGRAFNTWITRASSSSADLPRKARRRGGRRTSIEPK